MVTQNTLARARKLKLHWFVALSSLPLLGVVAAFGVIPIALWRRSRPPARLRAHLIAGALLGTSPFLLLGIVAALFASFEADWQRIGGSIRTLIPFALIGAIAGTAAAFVFFLTSVGSRRAQGSAA